MIQSNPERNLVRLIRTLLKRQQVHARRGRAGGESASASGSLDRRGAGRKGYHCWQLAAFYDGKRLPQQMDFRLVQCRDLSPEGFSFYHESVPRQRRLIVALGTPPFDFFEAEMVRREPAHCERERGWIIGCRFTRRLRQS
jgi:hypothetical protein